MSSHDDAGKPDPKGLNRRLFLQNTGGVATGLAVTVVPSAAVALVAPATAGAKTERLGDPVDPSGDVPTETVMAYVQDAEKGYVTVLSGTVERTYHDPVLAKRLLDAARAQTA